MGTVGHRQVHAGLRGPGQHLGPAMTEGFQVEPEGQLAIPELLSPGRAGLQREDRETLGTQVAAPVSRRACSSPSSTREARELEYEGHQPRRACP